MQFNRGRRDVLRQAGAGVTAGITTLSGCSSTSPLPNAASEFNPDQYSTGLGELPIHDTSTATDVGYENLDQAHVLQTEKAARATKSGEIELNLSGAIDAKAANGTLGMSAGASCGTFWQAPADGTYYLSVTYTGEGGYLVMPPDDAGRDYTISSGITLAVLKNPEEERAARSMQLMQHGSPGIRRRVAEELLEFLAFRLVAPHLGLVGKLIAKALINWTIDIPARRPNTGQFQFYPRDPGRLTVAFTAKENRIYKLQFAPVMGFTMRSYRKRWAVPKAFMDSTYELNPLSISRK